MRKIQKFIHQTHLDKPVQKVLFLDCKFYVMLYIENEYH